MRPNPMMMSEAVTLPRALQPNKQVQVTLYGAPDLRRYSLSIRNVDALVKSRHTGENRCPVFL